MIKTDRIGVGGKGVNRRAALGLGLSGAALAACATPEAAVQAPALYAGAAAFAHGVASGDPLADRVVLWTRVTPAAAETGPAAVRWSVAKDKELKEIVASGVVETSAARDFTVKVDASGLAPGGVYFYGFETAQAKSPIGRTRTLPAGAAEKLTAVACSCSNHPFGFFNAYAEIAKIADLDLVLHLGDYIYEYGPDGYGGDVGQALGRAHAPAKEIVTLADYRTRHAQYKSDPDLQAAHAAAPWLVTWDDHELTNDTWMQGAQNHQPETEGAYEARKAAALQAYYEWLPIRDPETGKAFEAINRSFQFGDLASIIMIETRLMGRSKQLDYAEDLPLRSTVWDMSRTPPRPMRAGAPAPEGAVTRPTPFDVTGKVPRPILSWARVEKIDPTAPPKGVAFLPDLEAFAAKLNAPDRALLGAAQEAWLKQTLEAGKAAGSTWRLFGNQVIMARINAPDLTATPEPVVAGLEKLYPPIRRLIALTKLGLPFNLDAWDGYPAQRERLHAMLREVEGNTLVVTGDTHTAWANEVTASDGARLGAEFAATSITSPGLGNLLAGSGLDLGGALTAKNPDIKWTDQVSRGFVKLTLSKTEARADYVTVSTITAKTYTSSVAASFTVKPEAGPTVGAITKV
jgi:alkaline phosphatase D